MNQYKLGRLAPAPIVGLCDLTFYLTKPLPAPPAEVDAPNLEYAMACNDQIGDCTIASVVHTDQATANLTTEAWTYPGDSAVSSEYFKLSGGQDTGLAETAVLAAWLTSPGLFGHELAAFAPIHVKHTRVVKQTTALVGAVYAGVLIPEPAEQQFQDGEPWELTHTSADSQIEGGHAVPIVGYNATGPIVVTWGALQQVTWAWWLTYAEEAYAVITAEVKERGVLHGVDFSKLDADLNVLRRA
jgi:hypothetical protein